MGQGSFDKLKLLDIPTTLRICAGTDGSVTYLLEVMTKQRVDVQTRYQQVVNATNADAQLLMIEPGEPVNLREVVLSVSEMPYVKARSLAPIHSMPQGMRNDLMRADIPIGRILRKYKLETRRDILSIDMKNGDGIFKDIPVLSREYVIIHDGKILMWINELFPVDARWEL
ncbi:MAG: chorismate lyase [ANME-2 cluster archaeon]|nr:chorismate lyase [ANME-2 cluster archaeon]